MHLRDRKIRVRVFVVDLAPVLDGHILCDKAMIAALKISFFLCQSKTKYLNEIIQHVILYNGQKNLLWQALGPSGYFQILQSN
jgi:hypothetical protein